MGDNAQQKTWILEFLLRQPIQHNILNRLILSLPHPISDHRLLKTLLIKRISTQSISEHILESLELIEEIDHINGVQTLNSMKDAYCAVVMDCVVRFLRENPRNWGEYSSAVGRIQRRVGGSLISEWVKDLMSKLEEMANNGSVCEFVLMKDTEKDARDAVGVFVVEVYEDMGPSFLEMVAEKVGTTKNCNVVLTPEYMKVKEALNTSMLELNDVVQDPLPEALRVAATISADMAKEVEIDRGDCTVDKECDVVQGNMRIPAAASRHSIMERNNTARTLEWDDETASSSKGYPDRPHLPTPRSRIVTPLRRQEIRHITGRRQKKKWSPLEEQTLRLAVNEYGRGNWKMILDNYHHIFEGRNTVDLKDKWRNMTK